MLGPALDLLRIAPYLQLHDHTLQLEPQQDSDMSLEKILQTEKSRTEFDGYTNDLLFPIYWQGTPMGQARKI
jgi:hypothetical protein